MADACVANTNNAHATPSIAYNFIEPSGGRTSIGDRATWLPASRRGRRIAESGPEMVVIIAPRMPSAHHRENIEAAPDPPFAASGNGIFVDSRVTTARLSGTARSRVRASTTQVSAVFPPRASAHSVYDPPRLMPCSDDTRRRPVGAR